MVLRHKIKQPAFYIKLLIIFAFIINCKILIQFKTINSNLSISQLEQDSQSDFSVIYFLF